MTAVNSPTTITIWDTLYIRLFQNIDKKVLPKFNVKVTRVNLTKNNKHPNMESIFKMLPFSV